MQGAPSIGYIAGTPAVEIFGYEDDLFGCLNGEDVGLRCCIVQTCPCSGIAHSNALGWVNTELGAYAWRAYFTQLVANSLRAAANSGPTDQYGRVQTLPVVDVLATTKEIEANLSYFAIRQRLSDLMFGVWAKDVKTNEIYLEWAPATNHCNECLIQTFCSPCARCQEVSSVMKWRQRVTGKPVRYSVFNCSFQELQESGNWSTNVSRLPPSRMLQGENLLGRSRPYEVSPAPLPLVAMRV